MLLLTSTDAAKEIGICRQVMLYHARLGHVDFLRSSDGDFLFTPESLKRFRVWRKKRARMSGSAIARQEAAASK